MVAECLFWIAAGLLIYIYAGYPLLCWLLGLILRRGFPGVAPAEENLPRVSIVTAAHNEAAHIAATIENKLALDYPADRLEIVIVSDASTDETDAIVGRYAGRGVRLVRQDPRAGKTSGLNLAIPQTTGSIIAFADANSLWARDALRHLVAPFADDRVGYVTGRMLYRAADGSLTGEGCTAYMRYENRLREWETRIGSIVGVDGGIDAVRRELYVPMRPDQLPDFVLPLTVRGGGKRVVYAPRARLHEEALKTPDDEFSMRVRVTLRAWHALRDKAALLSPLRYGLFAWQLFSHKLLRYLGAFLQIAVFAANLALLTSGPEWMAFFLVQVIFYAAAWFGHLTQGRAHSWPILFPYYICLINTASFVAFILFLRGKKQVVWSPRT